MSGMQNLIVHALGFGIKLRCQFTKTLPTAFVDANQLQLALLNMAIGVRDAMPCGGSVVISGAERSKDGADSAPPLPPGDYVRIRMIATSVSEEEPADPVLNKLVLTEPSPSGMSLGFSIAQAMATRFGGLLALVSAPNAVTCADLWLPQAFTPSLARSQTRQTLRRQRPAAAS